MPINVQVEIRKGESTEKLIKRFFKKCKKEDIVKEYLYKTSHFKTRRELKRDKILKNKYLESKK